MRSVARTSGATAAMARRYRLGSKHAQWAVRSAGEFVPLGAHDKSMRGTATDLWTVRWTLFACWTTLAECQFS
jgi:hypothetical protein